MPEQPSEITDEMIKRAKDAYERQSVHDPVDDAMQRALMAAMWDDEDPVDVPNLDPHGEYAAWEARQYADPEDH